MKIIQPGLTLWLAIIILILSPFFLRIIVIKIEWKILKDLANIINGLIRAFIKVIWIRIQLFVGSIKIYVKTKKVEKFIKKIRNKLRKAGLMMTEKGEIVEIEQDKSFK